MKTSSKYNQSVEFWNPELVSDGMGGSYPSYKMVFADYANIVAKEEKRGLQENQLVLVGYFDISIRFRRDVSIDKSFILKHQNEFYIIHSIVNFNDREFRLTCTSSNDQFLINEIPGFSDEFDDVFS